MISPTRESWTSVFRDGLVAIEAGTLPQGRVREQSRTALVQPAHPGKDALHVTPGLAIGRDSGVTLDRARAGIVCGERVLEIAEPVELLSQVFRARIQVLPGIADVGSSHFLPGARKNLHVTDRPFRGDGIGPSARLSEDHGPNEILRKIEKARRATDLRLGQRERFPLMGSIIRRNPLSRDAGGARLCSRFGSYGRSWRWRTDGTRFLERSVCIARGNVLLSIGGGKRSVQGQGGSVLL